VAFASRSLSSAEQRYAQIEKEALEICWACEKFHCFLAGLQFTVETDHKPLLSILGEKELAKEYVRVQQFRLRMMSFTYNVVFIPGTKLALRTTENPRRTFAGTGANRCYACFLNLSVLHSGCYVDRR